PPLSTGVSYLPNQSVRSRCILLSPYYALFQAPVLPPLGACYYLSLRHRRGSLAPPGRYRIGLRRQSIDLGLWRAPAGPRIAWVARVMRITATQRYQERKNR